MYTDALNAAADSHGSQAAEHDKGIIADMGDAVSNMNSVDGPSVHRPRYGIGSRVIRHGSRSANGEDTIGIVPCGVVTACAALGKKFSCACYKREHKNE